MQCLRIQTYELNSEKLVFRTKRHDVLGFQDGLTPADIAAFC